MVIARKALLGVALVALLFSPATARSADAQVTVPVVQTLDGIGTFTGNLVVTSFRVVNGELNAVGTLTGRITDTAGALLGTIATQVLLPVTAQQNASCEILRLELGPLDLNLLGLMVHLDPVLLEITAQPGAGNLLGNLLCQVAGLLDRGGPLAGLTQLLNQLLRALGGIGV